MEKITRHQRRIKLMQILFAFQFNPQTMFGLINNKDEEKFFKNILIFLPEIDAKIQNQAKERPIKDIAKIDLSILRLVIYEQITEKIAKNILINEAVELAKEFSDQNSYAFINAVLEKILLNDNKKNAKK